MHKLLLGLILFAASGSGLVPAKVRPPLANRGSLDPLFVPPIAGPPGTGMRTPAGHGRGAFPVAGGLCSQVRCRGRALGGMAVQMKDSEPEDLAAREARKENQILRESELKLRAGGKYRPKADADVDDELFEDGALEGFVSKEDDEFQLPYSKEIHDFLRAPGTEITIALLVLSSCFLIAIETLTVERTFFLIEDTISIIFLFEYLARWYSRQLKPQYLLRWGMVIDFVAILPFVIQLTTGDVGARGIYTDYTFLRLLRILRLQRFLRDQETFQRLIGSVLPVEVKVSQFDLQLFRIFDQIFTLLFITSGLIYNAEKGFNPQLNDFFSAFYYTIITLTTVGFGDITPVTVAGRTITSAAILVGIALIPYQLSNLARILLDSEKERKQGVKAQKKMRHTQEFVKLSCLSCGETLHAKRARFCLGCGNKLPELEDEQEYM